MAGNRGRGRPNRDRRPAGARARVRLYAAGAATMLAAVSVVATAPADAATIGLSGGGRTSPADQSNCTTKAQGVTKALDQTQTPWEIAYANTRASGVTGAGVKVAVIDSGITGSNSQVSKAVVGGKDVSSGNGYRTDGDGHGTMVASIIAAQQSGANGMVGIAPGASLLIYREAGCDVDNSKGNNEVPMAHAIDSAVAKGARVINISQAGYEDNSTLKAAVMNAYNHNVLIVAAAGNYGNSDASDDSGDHGINPVTYPAAYAPYLLTVGAAAEDGTSAAFSESGPYVSLTAPGVLVGGIFPDGKIWNDNGTSFAAPFVAGVAALLLQKHPDWSVKTLMKVLESTAGGNGSWTKTSGWGMVNVSAALNADSANLTGLYGAGPNADGPASAKPVRHGSSMQPIVAAAENPAVVNQRKGAYIALGAAILIVAVALAGTFIARDARRRRLTL
jgi:membrane-anchored mycosin MYCP